MTGDVTSPGQSRRAGFGAMTEVALILAVFALSAAWPAPDANETYYLGKAKHLWDPAWGSGELFLESKNAHAVFYILFGWLGRWVSLSVMAWVIRGCTWSLLALAWRRLSAAVLPRPGWAVLSAVLFVGANNRCNMAGEWVVGGAEAKGLAYVLVFLALERLARNDWGKVWPFLGGATSLHVLVGGWALVAAGGAWLLGNVDRPRERFWTPFLLGGCLAAPGLWWALRLNAGADAGTIGRAAHIMVFERASHHLLPPAFHAGSVVRHLFLWGAWFALAIFGPRTPEHRRIGRFVWGAMLIAALGEGIALLTRGHPNVEATLLQFYWFRLSDATVPVGVGLGALMLADHLYRTRPRLGRGLVIALATAGAVYLGGRAVEILSAPAPRADWTVRDPQSWREVCRWAANHTPPEARFLTPAGGASFLWYSGRRDVVNWKDVPQDAPGVVAWWNVMQDIHGAGTAGGHPGWRESLGELGADRLRELGRKYEASYAVLLRGPGPGGDGSLTEVYSNSTYTVVKLRD
jgi:uncharacterized protein DUF6798